MSDSEFAAQQQKFVQSAYEAADKNMNFVIDEEEFNIFAQRLLRDSEARGNYVDSRPETLSWYYRLANRINIHRRGVSLEEWNIFRTALIAKKTELKTNAGF